MRVSSLVRLPVLSVRVILVVEDVLSYFLLWLPAVVPAALQKTLLPLEP